MLEVRKNTFSRNYENSFFREISRHLFNSFKERNIEGVLIGSPLCEVDERLQIDALLITPSVVCIIDFKNFKGKINLPDTNNFDSGCWTTKEGELIKGGSSINPYMQLRNQKRRFIDVSNKYICNKIIDPDIFNPLHSVRAVCFQDEIELNGEIPRHDTLNFFILDKSNFIEKILDIVDVTDKEVILSQNSFNIFKSIFLADPFKIDNRPLEDKMKDFAEKSETLDYSLLHPDQNTALSEIKLFLEDPDQNVFILQGTSNSGKSFLIPYIQDIAFKTGIQETEIFASSSRVANNLMSSIGVEKVNSIYSYIYGGKKSELSDEEKAMVGNNEEQEDIQIESVPLKSCDNAENALFIIDETQLVSDSFYQSLDLIFGSGYLLKDFIRFTDFGNSKRKIIFIGDPYQLHIGRDDKTPLNPSYLEDSYSLKTNAYQLLDKPEFSDINKQALICVEGIRNQSFNQLRFTKNVSFLLPDNRDVFKEMVDKMIFNNKGHLLYFSNDDSQKANLWIKKEVLNNGTEIAKNDLIYFNNNISIEDENDPNSVPKRIFNGQFATVIQPNVNLISESIFDKKGKLIATINFREIQLKIAETENEAKAISFENYRMSPKAELSKYELLAYKIYLYKLAEEEIKNFETDKYKADDELKGLFNDLKNGKKVKSKINKKVQSLLRNMPATSFYKFKNAALLRFGWAMTVHKSMSYKWNEVIFNVDPGKSVGKTNQQHFKWLYTGISRAKQKIALINYTPISPFDKTEFVDSNNDDRQKEFFYIAKNNELPERLLELKEFIVSKLIGTEIKIDRIENLNWQERYHFKKNNEIAIISLSYNGQGKFRKPTLIDGNNELGDEIIRILHNTNSHFNFDSVKPDWKKNSYESLAVILEKFGIRFTQIIQSNYNDKIKLASKTEELDVEIDYSGSGAFTKATAKYYSNPSIWEEFKTAIEKIKL
ncbi:MAG: NERD domain-containing protein [Patescibacteria group bacterium]|jgi:hypothetical protein